ncbi:MAG: transcription-repair coupling factor, partial [Rhodoglobus sp.]
MLLDGFIAALSRAKTFEKAIAAPRRSADFSLVDGLRAPLLAALLGRVGGPRFALAITATGRESEALRRSLVSFLPDATVVEFPAWETLPHERLSPSAETVGKRIAALRSISRWDGATPFVLVASVRAALQPLADNLTSVEPIELVKGGRGYDLPDVSRRLVDLAYSRVDMVTRRGEFAVRGGIVDVFAPTDEHPLRLEFFGDELEEVREFSVADQRSLSTEIDRAELPPSRELLLSESVRQRAREMRHEFPSLSGMLAKIGEGIPVDGMESLAPALVDRLVPLTHYLPADAAIAVRAPATVATRAVS